MSTRVPSLRTSLDERDLTFQKLGRLVEADEILRPTLAALLVAGM
jgi:hypothetical protein